ncbi:MAG: class I SAM-dependent methyltransferase [Bacteroidota bacterium]
MNHEAYKQMFECENRHWWFLGMRAITAAILNNHLPWQHASISILDVGCGTGGTLAQFKNDARVTGVDLFPEALKFCQLRGLSSISQATVEALPFRENTFDLVTCFDVLNQLRTTRGAIAEAFSVLKLGGWLLIREPAYDFLRANRHDLALDTHHRFNATELIEKLESAGFRVSRVTYANTILFPIAAVMRLVERLLRLRNTLGTHPDLNFSVCDKLLFKTLRLEAKL